MKCSQCQSNNKPDSRFCATCGADLTTVQPQDEGIRGRSSSAEKKYSQGKNPTTALLLSLIPLPGVGQFYNGDVTKGVVMLIGSVVLGITGIGYIAIWVWAVIDAYQVAKGNWNLWS